MRFTSNNHAINLLICISFFLLIYDSNEAEIARKVVPETRKILQRDGTIKLVKFNQTSFNTDSSEEEESEEDLDSDSEYLTEPIIDFKDCAGTINGANVISTHYKSHYERLAKYYENCTIITGNLELTHVDKTDIEKADEKYKTNSSGKIYRKKPFWFLSNVREISGYLLIFYVQSDNLELPNLQIIRGRNLFEGNGLFVSRNNIKYLRMPKLRSVMKGGITVSASSSYPLCYLYNSIDFDHLRGDRSANISILTPKMPSGADVICSPEEYSCHPSCGGHCYGPTTRDCQELYRVDCPIGCDSCFTGPNGTKHCCHSECAAGCTGLGPKRCVSCQNYNQDGECVPECNGLEKYDREQSKIVPRGKDDRRYFYESYCLKECPDKTLIEGKYCVVACQAGHYRDVDVDRRKCVPCNGPCPKVCVVRAFLDVQTLRTLVNCSEIDGNLEILNHLYEEQGFELSLLNNLRSVKIVTGYVMIDGGGIPSDKKPTNLNFLENLKVIEGRDLHIRYSLVVQGLTNLTELGLRKLEKFSAGKAAFLNNSQLCYGKNLDWEYLNVEGVQYTHNAPAEFCAKYDFICHDTCDPTKGCWGKGPSQCLKCKHFVKDDECVNSCEPEEGLYRKEKNQCHRCDRECSTCYGPTASECGTCKHYRYEDAYNSRFLCVEKCPNNTYAYQNDCFPCHDNCYNNGCYSADSTLGTGCKLCRFGVNTDTEIQCLAGSDVMNACHGWDGYYPDIPSTLGIQQGECKRCRRECKTCVSLNNCTECLDYQIVSLESNKMIGCALNCGEGNYELFSKTSKTIGTCQQCHPLCDRTKSCKGPTEFDCDRCDYAGIDLLTSVQCVSECPESHKYFYENVCHAYDVKTEARNRKIIIVSIILIVLVVVGLVIGFLVMRCTRYRKKFEQEQQLHPPEIPEYDKNALTRRPNMNRLNVITRSQLTNSKRILGTGAFGTVYAGFYKVKDAKGKDIQIPVAIKEIKMDSSASWSTETEMIAEATIMASLDHEHLLKLVGICFVDGVKLVTVLRPMGSLRDFLVSHSNCLGARDLLLYCYQICSAMEYLTRHKIIHCDLAARNVLMRKNNHVEVTDFGLAKMLEGSNSAAAGSKVPFKWVPPELLIPRGQFSEASDVWAFGVTCWEIITYGATPYKEEYIQKGDEMYRFLLDGHRLKQPSNCGVHLHGTLISCWSETPASRPHFIDLKETFAKYCKAATEYIQDRHITQRMDSYIGSEEQQRHQIQRLLSLTDSAMGEQIYTDQNGFQFVYNPLNPTNLEDGRPMPISKKRNSSSASSRYKADPLRSHQSNTFDTRLTEVDTDEENYLVPNSAEMVKLDPNGCKYTKVNVPVINDHGMKHHQDSEEEPQKHHYQNDGVAETLGEYLNVDETTTEEDEIPPGLGNDTVKPQQQQQQHSPSIGSHKEDSSSSFSKLGNAYINQTESVL